MLILFIEHNIQHALLFKIAWHINVKNEENIIYIKYNIMFYFLNTQLKAYKIIYQIS